MPSPGRSTRTARTRALPYAEDARMCAGWDDDAVRDDNPFADFTAGDDYRVWLGSWAH